MTRTLRRKYEPWAAGLRYGGRRGTLEPCVGGHRDRDPERWVAEPGVGNWGVSSARDRGATDTRPPAGVNLQRKQATNFTAAGQPRREEAVSALCWGAGGETQVSGSCSVPSWGTREGASF